MMELEERIDALRKEGAPDSDITALNAELEAAKEKFNGAVELHHKEERQFEDEVEKAGGWDVFLAKATRLQGDF